MKRATRILLFMVWMLVIGCQLKPAKPGAPPKVVADMTPAAGGGVMAPSQAPSVPNQAAANPKPDGSEFEDDPLSEPAQANAPPDSRTRTITWDFGTIPPGTEARHKFSITNDSAGVWTLKQVSRSCACTIGELTPTKLKPSRGGSLEVSFRSSAKQALIAQTITIEFKEPNAPRFHLKVQGEISDSLSAVPAAVKFGRVTPGATPTRAFEVRNNSRHDIAITKIESPDWVRVEYEPVEVKARANRPRQKWHVVAHANPAALKPGLHTDTVVLHADSEDLEPLRIPVGLYVNAALEPIPGHLTFSPVASGKTTRKTMILEIAPDLGSLSETDLLITHNFGEELEVQPPRKVAKNRFLVTASFRPRRSPGAVKGELEIRARGLEVEPARVKIFGEVR